MRSCSSDLEKSEVERYLCVWYVVVRDSKELRRTLKNSEEQEAMRGVSVCRWCTALQGCDAALDTLYSEEGGRMRP